MGYTLKMLKLSLIIVTTVICAVVLLLGYLTHQLTAFIVAGLLVLPLVWVGLAACHNVLKLFSRAFNQPD
jgi:hypothetical protein